MFTCVHVCLRIGTPVIIVAISAGVSHEQYGIDGRLDVVIITMSIAHPFCLLARCWISSENGAIWGFIAPMLLIILVS